MRNWTYGLVTILLVLTCCHQKTAERPPQKKAEAEKPAKPAVAMASPIKPGVYGDVAYVEEAGDLVGAELQIPKQLGQPIEITLCEGNCNFVVRVPFVVKGNAIEFTYRDTLVDQNGKAEDVPPIHFRLEPRGKSVMLFNRQVGDDVPPELLRRLPKRDSLDYALEQMKEHGLHSSS